MPEGPSLADLGELELIRRLGAFAAPGQFDDDAAVLPVGAGAPLVVNTDLLVEDVHFSAITTSAEDVGWKAAAANLSDLAAMGCRSVLGLTVGLVAPPSTPWPWVEGVYAGLRAALGEYGGALLGGDCSRGAQRMLAVTALGRLAEDGSSGVIRRSEGRPGDALVCTGPHGLSRVGLALARGEGEGFAAPLPAELVRAALAAHRRPRPRLDVVAALVASRPASLPWRVGGCDSSDGLAAAVLAVATASGCEARLERGALPLPASHELLSGAEAWCLYGGEDFELVLALPPAWARRLVDQLPGAGLIGCLQRCDQGPRLGWTDAAEGDFPPAAAFQHFG
jgi:thiamine-monophosphate kinase